MRTLAFATIATLVLLEAGSVQANCGCGNSCKPRTRKVWVSELVDKVVPTFEIETYEEEVPCTVMTTVEKEVECTVMQKVWVDKPTTIRKPVWRDEPYTCKRPKQVWVDKEIEVTVMKMVPKTITCTRKVPVLVDKEVTTYKCVTDYVEETVMKTDYVTEEYCDYKKVAVRRCVEVADPCDPCGRVKKRWVKDFEMVPVMKTRKVPVCVPVTVRKPVKRMEPYTTTVKVCNYVDESYEVTVNECVPTKEKRTVKVCTVEMEDVQMTKKVCEWVEEPSTCKVMECVPVKSTQMVKVNVPVTTTRKVMRTRKVPSQKVIQVCVKKCIIVEEPPLCLPPPKPSRCDGCSTSINTPSANPEGVVHYGLIDIPSLPQSPRPALIQDYESPSFRFGSSNYDDSEPRLIYASDRGNYPVYREPEQVVDYYVREGNRLVPVYASRSTTANATRGYYYDENNQLRPIPASRPATTTYYSDDGRTIVVADDNTIINRQSGDRSASTGSVSTNNSSTSVASSSSTTNSAGMTGYSSQGANTSKNSNLKRIPWPPRGEVYAISNYPTPAPGAIDKSAAYQLRGQGRNCDGCSNNAGYYGFGEAIEETEMPSPPCYNGGRAFRRGMCPDGKCETTATRQAEAEALAKEQAEWEAQEVEMNQYNDGEIIMSPSTPSSPYFYPSYNNEVIYQSPYTYSSGTSTSSYSSIPSSK